MPSGARSPAKSPACQASMVQKLLATHRPSLAESILGANTGTDACQYNIKAGTWACSSVRSLRGARSELWARRGQSNRRLIDTGWRGRSRI
eukprot:14473662-Alexandrium_andersonii.AAC.1